MSYLVTSCHNSSYDLSYHVIPPYCPVCLTNIVTYILVKTHDVCHNLVIYLVIISPECRYDERVKNCNHNYLAPPCPALLETEITVESGEDSQVGAGRGEKVGG